MLKLNKEVVEFGKFPNGELYLESAKLKTNSYNRIYWEWEEENEELIKLMILKSHLDSLFTNSELSMSYMPYSRMDRKNDSYAFTLKSITEFINNMNFFAVTIREPHSDVTPALINKCMIEEWCIFRIRDLVSKYDIDTVFYPDAGAQKRYQYDFPSAVGNKVRDFKTGDIVSYMVTGTIGNNVLIVDDMCSRGGTFIEASKKLKELGAKKVYLLVSYLEKNVLTGKLADHVELVFASNNVEGFDNLVVLTDKSIVKDGDANE